MSQDAERIVAILLYLHRIYAPAGVGLWLFGEKRTLGGRRPVQLLQEGRIDEVERALPSLEQIES